MGGDSRDEDATYAVTYDARIEDPALTRAEIGSRGATDSVLIVTVMHLDDQEDMLDGATSSALIGINGRANRPMNPSEVFQIWSSIGAELAERLPEGKRKQLCKDMDAAIKLMFGVANSAPKGRN